jgi:outer membrane immunogenic protein
MKYYLAAIAAIVCAPGIATAQATDATPHFNGVRAEARLGYETPTVSDSGNVFKIGSAVSYGAEAGFDLRLGHNVVAGPYAVYEFSSVDLCDGTDCLSEDGNLGVGARVGVVVSPRVLVYGKIGYARIRFTASSAGVSGSESDDGVQGAIGLNLNFSRHVYGMAEINYADYGQFNGINLQRRHVAAGIGVRF